MQWLLNVAYLLGGIVYLPFLAYQMIVLGKNRRGWRERLGYVRIPPTNRPRIWFHAVSLGEVNATPTLTAGLQRRFVEHEIVISTTTDTGYARACKLYGAQRVFRFPLDFSWSVSRVLDRVRPDLIVLVELEVWPNLVRQAVRREVPVAVVNGRLTERSARRFGMLGGISRRMFRSLAWVGAQDDAIAGRFRSVGVPDDRITLTGSLKWDTASVSATVDGAEAMGDALSIDRARPLWVCGSTGPGEESIVLDAYQTLTNEGVSVRLAIVPRKPERFDEVARIILQRSFGCLRRSETPDGASRLSADVSNSVILGDTMGGLRKLYSLATVVFVGRSLVPMGGSDPMEVAALAKPIITGPFMDNFRSPVEAMQAVDALRVVTSADELAEAVARFRMAPASASRAGLAGQAVVIEHQGATDKTVRALSELMDARRAQNTR